MTRPSKTEMIMKMASVVSWRSTCTRSQVGCILTNLTTDSNWHIDHSYTQILAMGYNGMQAGGQNTCDSHEPGLCGCIHAEQNALIKAAPGPKACFVTLSPCVMCARLIVNADVREVYFGQLYRDEAGVVLLERAGIRVYSLAPNDIPPR